MNKIINLLKEKKSIPLDQFIDISLYNKEAGYLTNPKEAPTTHRETTEDSKYNGHIHKKPNAL